MHLVTDPDLSMLVSWDGWTGGYNRDSFCDVPPGSYPNNSAYWMPCDQIERASEEGDFDECGMLIREVQGVVECELFEADAGGRYLLLGGHYGFEVGDRIRVRGLLVVPCLTLVCGVDGCIENTIVSECPGGPCCDPRYLPGDRVQLLVDNPRDAVGLPAGMLGTVICCDSDDPDLPIFVSWDGWINGRNNDLYCDVGPNPYLPNSGWWMACDQIAPFTGWMPQVYQSHPESEKNATALDK
jgi:hypothetical protein